MKSISILIPCYNEEEFIAQCLDSIIANDYPKDKMEILVIDGMSNDKTREILTEYSRKYPFIKFLDNPQKYVPSALNIAIKQAKGDIIIRIDAHLVYPKDYFSKCVFYKEKYQADNIGGIWEILPRGNAFRAKAIANTLGHRFGSANSYFRTGSKKVREVRTFFGGCYDRGLFDKIGLFNEKLIRSQDIEFNYRLKKAGGKIFLTPDIISTYYIRSSFKSFFLHNVKDGVWAIYPLKFVKIPFCLRHYVPLIFVSSLMSTGLLSIWFPFFLWLFLPIALSYLLLSIVFATEVAIKKRDIRFLFLMPLTFAMRHIGYGLGSIGGLIKVII